MSVSQRISQVPPNTKNDHLAREMAALEQIGRGDRHWLPTLPDVPPTVRNRSGQRVRRLRISHGRMPGDNEIFSVTQEGKVGIGVPDPAAKLEVNGALNVAGGVYSDGRQL